MCRSPEGASPDGWLSHLSEGDGAKEDRVQGEDDVVELDLVVVPPVALVVGPLYRLRPI